jgi:hypothetical protein
VWVAGTFGFKATNKRLSVKDIEIIAEALASENQQ